MTSFAISTQQISCTINPNGIQSISLGNKVVTTTPTIGVPAQGLWEAMMSQSFTPISGSAILGPLLQPISISQGGEFVTTVANYSGLTVTTTYWVTGTDIDMSIVLKNTGKLPFNNFVFVLPTFSFGPNVAGNMECWDQTYILANSPFHPSIWEPFGVTWAQDGTYGVAFHSKSHFTKPTLFNAVRPTGPLVAIPPIANMLLFVQDSVLPGESLTIDTTIHLSVACDIKSLTSSYVNDFLAFAPPMQYTPGPKDNWPWLYFSSFDISYVTSYNPLGYDGANRRLDLPTGITGFEEMVSPVNAVTAGTIFWQPQGYNSRGCQYRADFDVWPPTVQQNLPTLINWYNSNGLHFGLLSQPSLIDITLNYTTDQTVDLDVNDQTEINELLVRFDNVAKFGVNAFYLDSFGADFNSYCLMKQLRARLGPNVPTSSEFTSDLMLAYSGVYTTLQDSLGNTQWYTADEIKLMHLLYPQATILTVDPNNLLSAKITPTQLVQAGLIPMVQDYLAETYLPYFTEYISGLTI